MKHEQKPTILYNNPQRTAFKLMVESYLILMKVKQVIGSKEAGNSEGIKKMIQHTSQPLKIFADGEKDLQKKIELGFNGLSSRGGHFYPEAISQQF